MMIVAKRGLAGTIRYTLDVRDPDAVMEYADRWKVLEEQGLEGAELHEALALTQGLSKEETVRAITQAQAASPRTEGTALWVAGGAVLAGLSLFLLLR